MRDVVRVGQQKAPIETQRFNSSNLHSGLYDFGTQDLYIRFHGNRIYIYQFVPRDVWTKLKQAESHGRYHYYNIRYQFPYEQITASDWPQQGRAAPQNNATVQKFLR